MCIRDREWSDEIRQMGVRTNADTPVDAAKARELGAEGIGCLLYTSELWKT